MINKYKQYKKEIKVNNEKCEKCQIKKAILVHHIDKDRSNNTDNNLMKLCHLCHMKIHHPQLEGKREYGQKHQCEFCGVIQKRVHNNELLQSRLCTKCRVRLLYYKRKEVKQDENKTKHNG